MSIYFQPQTDRFRWWYVNFEEPFVHTPIGFDTRDLALDLVVGPDRAWGWKDEEEFAESIARGLITADEERRIRAAGEDVIATIESGAYPFDASWTSWAPDLAWTLPELVSGWDRVNPT